MGHNDKVKNLENRITEIKKGNLFFKKRSIFWPEKTLCQNYRTDIISRTWGTDVSFWWSRNFESCTPLVLVGDGPKSISYLQRFVSLIITERPSDAASAGKNTWKNPSVYCHPVLLCFIVGSTWSEFMSCVHVKLNIHESSLGKNHCGTPVLTEGLWSLFWLFSA